MWDDITAVQCRDCLRIAAAPSRASRDAGMCLCDHGSCPECGTPFTAAPAEFPEASCVRCQAEAERWERESALDTVRCPPLTEEIVLERMTRRAS